MIEVVGITDAGWASLDDAARSLVRAARVVVGGRRHLAVLPDDVLAERRTWPSPLTSGLPAMLQETGTDGVVVLASGDPLVSGVGTTLIALLGHDAVRVHPAVSSETLARARMGWSAESCDVVTTVGRSTRRLLPFLMPGARLVVLCSDGSSPAEVARLLTEAGCGQARITAWWHLGGAEEGSRTASASAWGDAPTPDLVLLCLEMPEYLASAGAESLGPAPGRPETAFRHDGLITKRDVRAGALARLRPTRGGVLWDLGAGSGAVGLEWCLAAPDARCVAVERDPERAERVRENARHLGVDHRVDVVASSVDAFLRERRDAEGATVALSERPATPDAIFFGGGISAAALDDAVACLAPGGRLVAHGVTVETEAILHAARRRHGGTLTRTSVETLEPLGSFTGWNPARAVVSWSLVVGAGDAPEPAADAPGARVPFHGFDAGSPERLSHANATSQERP